MGSLPVILVGGVGIAVSLFALVRMAIGLRRGAPRELVVGYAVLVLASVGVTSLLLRVL